MLMFKTFGVYVESKSLLVSSHYGYEAGVSQLCNMGFINITSFTVAVSKLL